MITATALGGGGLGGGEWGCHKRARVGGRWPYARQGYLGVGDWRPGAIPIEFAWDMLTRSIPPTAARSSNSILTPLASETEPNTSAL